MFAGLDFGTSNSAIGIKKDKQVDLLPLFQEEQFLPSTLYTLDRNFVCEYIYNQLTDSAKQDYKDSRLKELQRAESTKRELGIDPTEKHHYFGKPAIEAYIENPEEGIFIKSPKSFLGSTGLSDTQLQFFEDLVSAMMLNIKRVAESQIEEKISQVVIGRPVNFQGVNSDKSNQQAIEIMVKAAKRCGYKDIEFLYEPLAAGVDFESGLTTDNIVLVVDIGGGTTDCSMVKMGPSFIKKIDRSDNFLAHSGQRIGGNDLDIHLAYRSLMPLFGLGTFQKKGIEVPIAPFWSAVATNNVGEQTQFTSQKFARELKTLRMDAAAPQLIERLIYLQESKQNHRVVRSAELAKVDISENKTTEVVLDYIENSLSQHISESLFESSIEKPLQLIKALIQDAISQAGVNPDIVYITGGTAKSPTVRKAVKEVIPEVKIYDGDYYGSVAAGLTKWAAKIFA
ncbi:molecular chaperone [Aliikangiella coralliicola]|uniref:Molecular chaperone n=1 Tax=Aliikangiella coralliicola TaxID=2592383 RepID=A0A545UE91_9GAMM|nr:molecular chaperone [Aliikangiella coralliicola]TQV87745.1 molecular chaperone [Aliikangiella coralliicola]